MTSVYPQEVTITCFNVFQTLTKHRAYNYIYVHVLIPGIAPMYSNSNGICNNCIRTSYFNLFLIVIIIIIIMKIIIIIMRIIVIILKW